MLIDIRMPGIGGIESARQITTGHPDTVVVLISIEDASDVSEQAERCGAVALLRKQDFGPSRIRRLGRSTGPRRVAVNRHEGAMNILSILPLAFVMIAGPQIISAVFLATSDRWQANSAAYVFGASLSITAIVTAAFLVADSATSDSSSSSGSSDEVIDAVIVALLLFAAFHVYRGREKAEPPKWMGRLQEATPRLSFKLGFLLLGIFPTDIATSVTVGTYLARHDELVDGMPPIRRAHVAVAGSSRDSAAAVRQAGQGVPAQGARLDERQFVDGQRSRDRVVHRHHAVVTN